jgi:hypothetical protein
LYGQFECRHGMTESHIITTTPLCNHGARKIRGVKGITVSTVVREGTYQICPVAMK